MDSRAWRFRLGTDMPGQGTKMEGILLLRIKGKLW